MAGSRERRTETGLRMQDVKDNKILSRFLPAVLVVLLICAGLFWSFRKGKLTLHEFRKTSFYMDTYVEIIIAAPAADKKKADEAIAQAFHIFADLEKKFNFFNSESLLQNVNKQVSAPIKDEDLLALLRAGLDASAKTDGAFDITLGALKNIYPIGAAYPVPPSGDEIKKALAVSGFKLLKLNENHIEKPAGLLIDLGGILKGYAVEKASDKLLRMGIKNYIVNGGGNIHARGINAQGKLWKIGVEHPRAKQEIIAVIPLDNQSVATSGDYQRYFFYKNVRYHHILDPATGKPANRAISATVIAPDAMTADIYSTASFVLGRKKGIGLLEKNGLEGMIIDEKGYSLTRGLKSRISVEYK